MSVGKMHNGTGSEQPGAEDQRVDGWNRTRNTVEPGEAEQDDARH
jgi:hypothetical protein